MPQYPFMELWQGDALDVLADAAFLAEFDVIHASPVCKRYSALHARVCKDPARCKHPDEIADVRAALIATGKPYVIENVVGAPLADEALVLCGSMFGLHHGDAIVKRHRLFESNVPLTAPGPCVCAGRPTVGIYGTGGAWTRTAPGGGGVKVSGADAAAALGIDWTDYQPVLSQAIPPSYTEHLGRQLLAHLSA